jgi:hypothetical protein
VDRNSLPVVSCQSTSHHKVILLEGCTPSTLQVTSGSKIQLLPKYGESKRKCIARWWQHASVVPVRYPGNCGIFAFCTEGGMPRRKSCIVCALRLYQHYSICFLTSRFLGSSQSSQPHSSPLDLLSRRRQPCAAPSIIAMCKPTEPISKCVPAGTAAKQADATDSIILLA